MARSWSSARPPPDRATERAYGPSCQPRTSCSSATTWDRPLRSCPGGVSSSASRRSSSASAGGRCSTTLKATASRSCRVRETRAETLRGSLRGDMAQIHAGAHGDVEVAGLDITVVAVTAAARVFQVDCRKGPADANAYSYRTEVGLVMPRRGG